MCVCRGKGSGLFLGSVWAVGISYVCSVFCGCPLLSGWAVGKFPGVCTSGVFFLVWRGGVVGVFTHVFNLTRWAMLYMLDVFFWGDLLSRWAVGKISGACINGVIFIVLWWGV